MRKIERWQQQSLTFLKFNATTPVALPINSKNYWVTAVLLDFEFQKGADGGAPTTYQDYFYRAVQQIQISGGGRKYFTINGPDLRIAYWHARLRGTPMLRTPDMQATAANTMFFHQLPIIFSPEPITADGHPNFFDSRFGLAPDSDLNISITWNGSNAWGSNRNLTTGSLLRVTLLGVIPPDAKSVPSYYPEWNVTTHVPDQNYSGLGDQLNLPVGWQYRRSAFMFLNGANPSDIRTDGYSGNAISEVGFVSADERDPLNVKTWTFSQQSQEGLTIADDNSAVPGAAAAYGAATMEAAYNPGVGVLDWGHRLDTANPQNATRLLGANLENKQQTALSVAYTVDTAANTNVIRLDERYKSYPWAVKTAS